MARERSDLLFREIFLNSLSTVVFTLGISQLTEINNLGTYTFLLEAAITAARAFNEPAQIKRERTESYFYDVLKPQLKSFSAYKGEDADAAIYICSVHAILNGVLAGTAGTVSSYFGWNFGTAVLSAISTSATASILNLVLR